MTEPRGAGRAGGLLFLAVGLFVLYLVVTAVAGVMKVVIGAVLVVALLAFAVSVVRRR